MTDSILVPRELLEAWANYSDGKRTAAELSFWANQVLAQPASEPKPVGYATYRDGKYGSWLHSSEKAAGSNDSTSANCGPANSQIVPLFTHPEPAGVVLPHDWEEKLHAEMQRRFELSKRDDHWLCIDDTQIGVEFAADWVRACLDEVARLNGVKP